MKLLPFLKLQSTRKCASGASFVEVALTLPAFLALIFFVIDITKLTWIKSSVRSAMTLAIKKAESNPDFRLDLRTVSSVSDPAYARLKAARQYVVDDARAYDLGFFHRNSNITFDSFSNIDLLQSSGLHLHSTSAAGQPNFALVRPGEAVVSHDSQGVRTVTNNTHICVPNISGGSGDPGLDDLAAAASGAPCPSGVRLAPAHDYGSMLFKYPTEMLSQYTVPTLLFGDVRQKVVVGGYNNDIRLAVYVTPTPTSTASITPTITRTPTSTPTATITQTPATPTPTVTPTPSQTISATVTPTVTGTIKTSVEITKTPTPTATQTATVDTTTTATPTSTPTQSPTTTATATATPSRTATATPSRTATATPTRSVCEDNMVYKVNFRFQRRGAWDRDKKVITGDYPRCIESLLNAYRLNANDSLREGDSRDDNFQTRLVTMLGLYGKFSSKDENGNFQYDEDGNPLMTAVAYMDENCNRIPNPGYFCLQFTNSMVTSPVSLIWEKGTSIKSINGLTQFPLNPEVPGKWYDWRASAKTPLLVYDPENKGKVDSAEMLFGSHSFGQRWQNGYKALAKLDANTDGMLSGTELNDISLWFDNNQDGVSDSGEMKRAKDAGVLEIYTLPSSVDEDSGDVHAEKGFKRDVNGAIEVLPSVDWFSKEYDSKMHAIAEKGVRKTSADETLKQKKNEQPEVVKDPPKGLRMASGFWKWQVNGESPFEGKNPQGYLALQDKGSKVSGMSLIEVPLHENAANAQSVIASSPLQGVKTLSDQDGRTALSFTVTDSNGSETVTDALLSEDGKHMSGRSVLSMADESGAKIGYSWTAVRVK